MADKDIKKFKLLVWCTGLLCVAGILFSLASETILPEYQARLERKIYFERVISKKGLPMYPAKYWKKKDSTGKQ